MPELNPITNQDLQRGYFFLLHRALIRRIIWIVAIVVVALLYLFILWQAYRLLRQGSWQSQAVALSQNTVDWQAWQSQHSPQPLLTQPSIAIPVGDRLYNLAAFVVNSNQNWHVRELTYRFVVDNNPLPESKTFLNPGESRWLVKVGYKAQAGVSNIRLEILSTAWQPSEKNSPQKFSWQIDKAAFTPAVIVNGDQGAKTVPARVTWKAKNMSLFDFWQVDWQLVLWNGDRVQYIAVQPEKNFNALEERTMTAVVPTNLAVVSKIDVLPVLNWLDKNNIKALEYRK